MTAQTESATHEPDHGREPQKPAPFLISLSGYALAGGAALFVLSLIEWIDLNASPGTPFDSLSARLLLCVYSSLNVLAGLILGLFVGLFAPAASFLKKAAENLMAPDGKVRARHGLLTGLTLAVVAAFALNQQPHVHRYVIGVLREAEKIDSLRDPLLSREQFVSYLVLLILVTCCWALWKMTIATKAMSRMLLRAWLSSLILLIAAGYYIDSRVEVQQYEDTLHVSMYLFNLTLAMPLIGSVYFSLPRILSRRQAIASRGKKTLILTAAAMLVSSVAFTLFHFGSSQTLKAIVFYHTAQTKQSHKLAWWALDFDGDKYPSLMGGGDTDEGRADINPGQLEVVGDGVDNNCISGDLGRQDIDDWMREHSLPHITAAPAQRFNIVFIFIDALRADHLGIYGYPRNVSPNIDKLAARSTVFENGFTPSPNTYEALPKFMQSSYWDGHFETWTEVLARNGYNALLFPRRILTLRRHVKGMTEAYQGKSGRLDYTVDKAIEILAGAKSDNPFCAYLYATDPHRPYLAHAEFNFGPSLTDRYDGEIAYADSQLGRLFDWMETSGRLKDTVIVVMADHGESLGERGVYKHSSQLYNEQARVPMIIYVPNVEARRVADYVSTIDLGSTILDIAGLDRPEGSVGVSLLPLMMGERLNYPSVYGEQTNKQESPYVRPEQNVHYEIKKYMVITQDGYKLIYNRNFYTFELFDLKNDPGENCNVYDRLPEKASKLKRLLGRFVDVVTASRPRDADESKYLFGKFDGADDE